MAKKTIHCTIDTVDEAIRAIEEYQSDFLKKIERLRDEVAIRIAGYASQMFNSSVVADTLTGARYATVDVEVEHGENITLIIARGEDAVFVEFGAGVYHNGPAGSSPHPEGDRLGFTIGSYGKGDGSKRIWGYMEDGELVLTHGTPAAMPMYTAIKIMCNHIEEIAKGVFA